VERGRLSHRLPTAGGKDHKSDNRKGKGICAYPGSADKMLKSRPYCGIFSRRRRTTNSNFELRN